MGSSGWTGVFSSHPVYHAPVLWRCGRFSRSKPEAIPSLKQNRSGRWCLWLSTAVVNESEDSGLHARGPIATHGEAVDGCGALALSSIAPHLI